MLLSTCHFVPLLQKLAEFLQPPAVVEDFCSRLEVLPYDMAAAAHYGNIRAVLEQQGTPIGVNDLYIAGQARSRGLVLVTHNLRKFQRVPGLLLENWIAE